MLISQTKSIYIAMILQKLMLNKINSLCGQKKFITDLKKYSNLTIPKNKVRYILLINSINELYFKEVVNVEFNTLKHHLTVIKAVDLLTTDNLIFKNKSIKLMIEMMEYNLNFVKDVRLIA